MIQLGEGAHLKIKIKIKSCRRLFVKGYFCQVSEPHLDTKRARVCVESVLEKLSGRQIVVSRNWQSFQTNVVEKRELLVQWEQNMMESTKVRQYILRVGVMSDLDLISF